MRSILPFLASCWAVSTMLGRLDDRCRVGGNHVLGPIFRKRMPNADAHKCTVSVSWFRIESETDVVTSNEIMKWLKFENSSVIPWDLNWLKAWANKLKNIQITMYALSKKLSILPPRHWFSTVGGSCCFIHIVEVVCLKNVGVTHVVLLTVGELTSESEVSREEIEDITLIQIHSTGQDYI